MDLGIAGRKAIVCASSRGLGLCLRQGAGRSRLRGRDQRPQPGTRLPPPPPHCSKATGAKIIPVAADVASPEGQKALFAACPEPDILVNNNAGPPFRDFRELDRQKMIDGVIANMVVAVELIQKAIDPMVAKKFGRIVNITSGSVKMPIAGLDLSSGARAGLTAFLAGVARTVAASNVTINFVLPGTFDTDRFRSNIEIDREEKEHQLRRGARRTRRHRSGETHRPTGRIRRHLRVPLLGAGRLHHRTEYPHRRRRLSGRVLKSIAPIDTN